MKEKINLKSILILISLILILWIGSGYFIYLNFPRGHRGEIGDMFGAINALFSGLALAGIIITLILQQKELSLQRQEFILNREELAKSASAQQYISQLQSYSAQLSAHNTLMSYYIKALETVHTSSQLDMTRKDALDAIKIELDEVKELILKLNDLNDNLTNNKDHLV